MATLHNLGFPRIGKQRELKFALENYWRGDATIAQLEETGSELREQNWQLQQGLDFVPVADFSFYDQVLDTSFLLGHIPSRAGNDQGSEQDRYFRIARGRSQHDCCGIAAGEMTKWFDSNYHYIVPELAEQTEFKLNPAALLQQIHQAQQLGHTIKPVVIGPLTYLWLSKTRDGSDKLSYLSQLLPVYSQLLATLQQHGVEWVQIDEPILVTELDRNWRAAFELSYHTLKAQHIKLLLTTYFGQLGDNLQLACNLPVAGLHLDAINARDEVARVIDWLPQHKVLSLGIINGRNIWKTDLTATLDWLKPIAARLGERLWLAPSCSLLHVPVDLASEQQLDSEIKNWLAFAVQKLEELQLINQALQQGLDSIARELAANAHALGNRRHSTRVHNPAVQQALQQISAEYEQRHSPYPLRAKRQQQQLKLPLYPTTTIGSFPQTAEIRQHRRKYKQGQISKDKYQQSIRYEIGYAIKQQQDLGLDVLVHGEAERNDMVEYFGEQLQGYAFSQYGWVQSYGSRCVKPPIIYGDIHRSAAISVDWACYAQSLSDKPVKGMLTGPVTLLNWSFVRDDLPREQVCRQLALAIRDEVCDLEHAGIRIIQIDEAALREGLPLRRSQWQHYLDWAVSCFRIAANGVKDETQIHTHMCYSEFNDIITAIAAMDADVITIETSRSNMELLDAFEHFDYPNQIGPGVYDIHSPNLPEVVAIKQLIQQAARRIPAERLWINPDCGLKTRQWREVLPALKHMVAAATELRAAA